VSVDGSTATPADGPLVDAAAPPPRPEIVVGAAFAAGLVAALLVRRIRGRD
jgi:hypothetical protein